MLYFLKKKEYQKAKICGAFLGVSLLTFLVMYFAPGTKKRMGVHEESQLAEQIVYTIIVATGSYVPIWKSFLKNPVVWMIPLFAPDVKRWMRIPKQGLKIEAFFVYGVFLTIILDGAAFWGLQNIVPARVASLTLWFLGLGWILFWIFCSDYDTEGWTRKIPKLFKLKYGLLILALLGNSNFVALLMRQIILAVFCKK